MENLSCIFLRRRQTEDDEGRAPSSCILDRDVGRDIALHCVIGSGSKNFDAQSHEAYTSIICVNN